MKRDYQALALANSMDPKRFMKGGLKTGKVPESFAVRATFLLQSSISGRLSYCGISADQPDWHGCRAASTFAKYYDDPRAQVPTWSARPRGGGRCRSERVCQAQVRGPAVETDGEWARKGVEEEDEVVV